MNKIYLRLLMTGRAGLFGGGGNTDALGVGAGLADGRAA